MGVVGERYRFCEIFVIGSFSILVFLNVSYGSNEWIMWIDLGFFG